jgi:hypothetical protein
MILTAVCLNPDRAYGTSVVLFRCPFVPEIMHRRAPEVFLNQ